MHPSPTFARFKEDFDNVEGWFSEQSAALFDAFLTARAGLGDHGPMLEIGVYKGLSAGLMSQHLPAGQVLHLNEINPAFLAGAVASLRAARPDIAIREHGGPSAAIDRASLPARRFAMVHVDADHMRTAVLSDMAVADHCLSETGLLVLDDFLAPQYFSTTFAAVEYLVRKPDSFRFILTGFNKAYLCRPSAYLWYLAQIRDFVPGHLRACGVEDFTFWKMAFGEDFVGFGVAGRQYEADFVTWRRFEQLYGGTARVEDGSASMVDFGLPPIG